MRALYFVAAVAVLAPSLSAEAKFGRPPAQENVDPSEVGPLDLDPSPHYTPRQVVDIQVGALAANGAWGEDQGLALAFRFASPDNRRATGPFPHFATMVRQGYGALLDARDYDLGPVQMHHGAALIPVIVTAKDGEQHGFVWVLGRQSEGRWANCWLTDAVFEAPLTSVSADALHEDI